MADRLDAARSRQAVLGGCALVVVSMVLPVMRWTASDVHSTAGSARVFLGDGFTLVDGGFPGTGLVPVSAAAVVAVAAGALLRGRVAWAWWLEATAAALLAYYPLWVALVFVKKREDQVYPAEGALVLVLGCACVAAGVWSGRPTAAGSPS